MDFGSVSGISGTQLQQGLQKANGKLQAAIASLVSGTRLNKASDNIAELTIATQLQSHVVSLKQISVNLAQATSLAQVADDGIEQIQERLQQLQSLATQANSPVLSEANRQQLNEQFKQIKDDIERIAKNTTFNGQKLLNGDLQGDRALSLGKLLSSGDAEGDNGLLSIGSLSTDALFAGKSLDVLSSANAGEAVAAIGEALNHITSVRASVGAFEKSVNYAAASIDSAVANEAAARSILSDADFAETSTQSTLADIQRNATLALAAQGRNLNPGLLQLIG